MADVANANIPDVSSDLRDKLLGHKTVLIWAGLFALIGLTLLIQHTAPDTLTAPEHALLPVADWLNQFLDWFAALFQPVLRTISAGLAFVLNQINAILAGTPWIVTVLAVLVIGHFAGGWRFVIPSALALLYILVTGYWVPTMSTWALVFVATPLSILLGLALGIAAFKVRALTHPITVSLDLMQTVPMFAYLIPVLILFGFGPVPGLVATVIYATPPMVRNVYCGLEKVPNSLVESGQMAGCSPLQMMWSIELPSALPSIMLGINQTIMMALSMVVIAAVIGGFNDIGWLVLSEMRKAEFGNCVLAGLVVVFTAVIMDRFSAGIAKRVRTPHHASEAPLPLRYPHLSIGIALLVGAYLLSLAVPALGDYPKSLTFHPAEYLDDAVAWFTSQTYAYTDAIKAFFLYGLLLPLKIGLKETVNPFTWGFEPGPLFFAGYFALVAAAVAAARYFAGWQLALGVTLLGLYYFFGATELPWPAFVATIAVIGWQTGGWRVASIVLGACAFVLVTGIWGATMLSFYLASGAVLVAFLLGTALGVWAAINDRVSAVLRPINDTIQTIPLFVFLIPIIMVFLVGDFSGMLAIAIYAIVPAIRYTEHGIRNVSPTAREAAAALGCSRMQQLLQVELPLALPDIMLGFNQTVLLGLAMLSITALIGTTGLEQLVYEALAQADFGKGMVAGLGLALIAIVTDRITRGWVDSQRRAMGMARRNGL
ncbi:ABC transporter permease subunit [Methyloligella sp. 2.7D]|uniref:ABC transporter permease n=1 Tax=unclassified Methyloligella TaxID=2625955 RepID=UPI00157D8C4D|nr:ABC transporter permease subunit [Methyloligella sp. GL2]QKP76954.1 ABC transporter permease subunit [Methyloligella sp. GL2]